MGLGLTRIGHVKLPVTDLHRSVAWYRALLDLEVVAEFVEQGELRGVQLVDPTGAYAIALRDRRYCAGEPDLAGFDSFAVEAESLAALNALATRCEELGVANGGVQDHGEYGASLDVQDPDATVLRFVAHNLLDRAGRFFGVESGPGGQFTMYTKPRFTA